VAEAALSKGLLINNATETVVRVAPPLVITDAEIDRALTVLEEVWREVSAP
jgi:acetylornithine/succinyldiaminopimelate/putrescine aminotransferase